MENILNDQVLYDFVSFLLDHQHQKSIQPKPERRSQELYEETFYHYSPIKQEVLASDHEIEQFLADGFTPIVEIELD